MNWRNLAIALVDRFKVRQTPPEFGKFVSTSRLASSNQKPVVGLVQKQRRLKN